MKHFTKFMFLTFLSIMLGNLHVWGVSITYTLTIDANDFNTTSYTANNNEKTTNAICTTNPTKTFEVKWTSNQIMKQGNNMQWQKNNGYIYNSTDLGTITNVAVTSSAGSFTTYYGTSENPSSSTTVGNGFFKIKVGNATGTSSKVEITFNRDEGPTPTHSLDFYINGTHVEGYPKDIAEGGTFTFPTAQATIESGDDIYTFLGWVANTPITEPTDTKPTIITSESGNGTMGSNDVTLYALYAIGTGVSGTYTLKYSEENDLSSSTSWGQYGKAYNYTAKDGGMWTIKAYKSQGMQINTGKSCSIKTPNCPAPITNIQITCSAAKAVGLSASDYSGSGTISYIVEGTDNTSQILDLTDKNVTQGYIVPKNGSTVIQKIIVNYGNTSYSNYCTTISGNTKAEAELSFANSEELAVIGESYTLQALTNPNELSPITYTSSNTDVATIEGTTVTLVATGTTNITASFAGNDDYKSGSATYTLQVVAAPAAPTFTPATGATVKVGDKIKIEPGNGQGSANKLYYTINGGDEQNKNTNSFNEITITDEMIGTLTISAYHTMTYGERTLTGTTATATYTVVNPVVTINEPATLFANTFDVTMTASPADATIYYTTDGTDPTIESTQYTGSAITLSATTTVKAIAVITVGEGQMAGKVVSQTYTKYTAATSSTGDDYYLVTDANTLADGDKIIIASTVDDYTQAMSTTQQTNNRTSVSVERDGDTITPIDNVAIFTLQTGNENRWLLYTESGEENAHGYIYAATSENGSNNYMKTKTESDINCNASITIDENSNAIIVFDGEHNDHNTLRFNSSNSPKLFSCYTSTNEKPVQIYRNAQIDAITMYENRTGIDAANFYDNNTITENADKTVTVNLYRSLVAGCWNAICLPFGLNDANRQKLFGEGYDLQAFTGVESDSKGTHLKFSKVSTENMMEAGTPYIVFPTQTVQAGAVVPLSNVTISATAGSVEKDGYAYHGFFAPTALLPDATAAGEEDKSIIYIGTGNKFVYAKGTTKNPKSMLKGYRGYFTLPEGVEYAKVSMELNCEDDTTTGISTIEGADTNVGTRRAALNEGVYDMQGRKVADDPASFFSHPSSQKGIYIMNGKKFIIK